MPPIKGKILVVEDEKDVRDLMVLHLKRDGGDVAAVEDGEQALALLAREEYQLVVLDWMLPGVSGMEICKRIRAQDDFRTRKDVPVLMVTARADSADIVLGLEMGADDYITKPFEIPVYLARARALLRRATLPQAERNARRLQARELVLDQESHRVTCKGTEVPLTPSEFKLLAALLSNPGRVLSRDRLIDLVQGEGVTVVDRSIDTHVFGLRKKLGDCADVIETVRGVGYRVGA